MIGHSSSTFFPVCLFVCQPSAFPHFYIEAIYLYFSLFQAAVDFFSLSCFVLWLAHGHVQSSLDKPLHFRWTRNFHNTVSFFLFKEEIMRITEEQSVNTHTCQDLKRKRWMWNEKTILWQIASEDRQHCKTLLYYDCVRVCSVEKKSTIKQFITPAEYSLTVDCLPTDQNSTDRNGHNYLLSTSFVAETLQ